MEDNQLIQLFWDRDETAISETERKYGRLCGKIAHNVLNNPRDAEECVSDTYLSLWNAIPPKRPTNLTAFVCKIVRNLSLKKLEYDRAQKRSSCATVSLSELEEVLPDHRFRPDVEDEEIGKLINLFLRSEKEETRAVFVRRYYFFDSVASLAKQFSYSEAKVKSVLFHTRNKLKRFLREKGVYV